MKLYRAQSIFDAIYLLTFSKEFQQTTTASLFYHNSITKPFFSLQKTPFKENPPTFVTLKYFRITRYDSEQICNKKTKYIKIFIMLRVYIIMFNGR